MAAPVLATKLHAPARRDNTVARPRLIECLNQGLNGRLCLITAPAGFGKTTLVVDWLARQPERPAAWVSLDENDSEPVRFITYLLAAIRTVHPNFAQTVTSSLAAPQPPSLDFLVHEILNECAQLPGSLILVLDDFHVVSAEKTHELVNMLIDYAPQQLYFIITSRDTPPLALPRWRVRGQLVEILAADLRFTPGEVQEFLNQTMDLSLDERFVRALETRTEGWAAGLQLAAISLRGTTDPDLFVDNFTGQDRRVADYLLTEVLDRQPEETREFLLQTSVLDRFNASLCAAVLGRDDLAGVQQFLETLEATDLFIVPLDNTRRWYRYHHLFAELLRERLRLDRLPEEINGLHLRAAKWHEDAGFLEDAVTQALKAGNHEYAARLISKIPLHNLWEHQIGSLVQKWAGEIPDSAVLKAPNAAVRIMYVQLLRGDIVALQKGIALVQDVEAVEPARAIFASMIARNTGDLEQALGLLQKAVPELSEEDIYLKLTAFIQIANCQFETGRLGDAEATLQDLRSWAPTDRPSLVNMRIEAVNLQGSIAKARGDYFRANRLFEEARDLAGQSGVFSPQTGITAFHLGSIHYQWNDLVKAEEYFQEATAWGERSGVMEISLNALLGTMNLMAARGDRLEGQWALEKFRDLTRGVNLEPLRALLGALEAKFELRMGNLEAAVRWANAAGLSFLDAPGLLHIGLYLPYTAIRLAEGRMVGERSELAQMVQHLDALIQRAEAAEHTYYLIRLLLLRSLALNLLGDTKEAMQSLHRSLGLAKPGSLMRVFLDQGSPIQRMLEDSLSYDVHRVYVRRLLVDFANEAAAPGQAGRRPAPDTSLPEALTEREYEILQLIAAGLSNSGIGEKLVISKNTVRTHIKNLYGKLGVESRTQAILRARKQGLL